MRENKWQGKEKGEIKSNSEEEIKTNTCQVATNTYADYLVISR